MKKIKEKIQYSGTIVLQQQVLCSIELEKVKTTLAQIPCAISKRFFSSHKT